MAEMAWEHAAEARAALHAIVTDPEHGVDVLSSPRTMSNLLKDLLPDAPREKSLLVAAAEAGLADTLREHVAQGMDSDTAIRLTASSFSAKTPMTPEACSWVTREIAVALGISQINDAGSSPGAASGQAGFAVRPTAVMPGPTESAAGYSPGAPGYAPRAAGYPPAAGYSPTPEQFFGPAPGIGYPPVQVPGLRQGYQPGLAAGQGGKSNTLAVTSFVLGAAQLLGWILILPGLVAAILAIVFGFVSINQIKRSGERGRGLAITGTVLGILGIVVALVVVIGVAAGSNS